VVKIPKTIKLMLNETLDLKITKLGKEGDGIASYEGYIIIVKDINKQDIGKICTIQIIKILKNYAFGKAILKT
jgi:predicted RNA-binding protein with TRAM domain